MDDLDHKLSITELNELNQVHLVQTNVRICKALFVGHWRLPSHHRCRSERAGCRAPCCFERDGKRSRPRVLPGIEASSAWGPVLLCGMSGHVAHISTHFIMSESCDYKASVRVASSKHAFPTVRGLVEVRFVLLNEKDWSSADVCSRRWNTAVTKPSQRFALVCCDRGLSFA